MKAVEAHLFEKYKKGLGVESAFDTNFSIVGVGLVASESTARLIRGTGLSTEGVDSSEEFIRYIRC
jgi:hypothetical protein